MGAYSLLKFPSDWAQQSDLLTVFLKMSTATEFLNSCQDGTNASMCSGIMLKNNDTSVE
jgi:hypothetical protein